MIRKENTMRSVQNILFNTILLVALTFPRTVSCERNSDPLDQKSVPKFQEIFSSHLKWEGHYVYNNTPYYSMLIVHSGYKKDNHGVIATFKDILGATLDVKGEQEGNNELKVVFTADLMFEHMNRIPDNFTFVGTLSLDDERWMYEGTVTVPDDGTFGLFSYTPTDGNSGPYFDDDSSQAWRYTLIIGVPILLALVGVAGTVGIVYWAVKKGYLRHVPKNYDSFNNPAVQFDNNKQTVHI